MNALLRKTAAVLLLCFSAGFSETPFIGRWQLVPEKSAEIGLYKALKLDITLTGQTLQVEGDGEHRTDDCTRPQPQRKQGLQAQLPEHRRMGPLPGHLTGKQVGLHAGLDHGRE